MAQGTSTTGRARLEGFVERYGPAALATILGLAAVETVVFGALIHYGVDLGWLYTWIAETFAVDVAPAPSPDGTSDGRLGWIPSLVLAWAIRRPLKPIEFAVAAVLTPAVALLPGFRRHAVGAAAPAAAEPPSSSRSEP